VDAQLISNAFQQFNVRINHKADNLDKTA